MASRFALCTLFLVVVLSFALSSKVRATPEVYRKKLMYNESPMPKAVRSLLLQHVHSDHQWLRSKYHALYDPQWASREKHAEYAHHLVSHDKDGNGKNKHQLSPNEKQHVMMHDHEVPLGTDDGVNDSHPPEQTNSHYHGDDQPSHMTNIGSSVNVFFMKKDLKVGKKMLIYFPNRDLSRAPSFLPRKIADSIPFSLPQLPSLLHHFDFSPNSPKAQAMEDTLRQCQTKPIRGETKTCATSLESMLDFVHSFFSAETKIQVLTTTHDQSRLPHLQNYTILDVPVTYPAPTMVACHSMPYPYAVFYCHCQKSKSEVFKVILEGENGGRVEALAVCHFDTSDWDPDHISFQVLKVKPGTTTVCHFFPKDNLVWVPSLP